MLLQEIEALIPPASVTVARVHRLEAGLAEVHLRLPSALDERHRHHRFGTGFPVLIQPRMREDEPLRLDDLAIPSLSGCRYFFLPRFFSFDWTLRR